MKAADHAPAEVSRKPPSFEEFALGWLERQKLEGGATGGGLAPKSVEDLEWRIRQHLVPAFGSRAVDAITIVDVDSYRLEKVREGRLSASSINKTLSTLAAILDVAGDYEWLGRNPARGQRRRLRAARPRRAWLDRAEQIEALLAGASVLDANAVAHRGQRRGLVAVLVFAGLRIGEALRLEWDDLDLKRGLLTVRSSKTDAGVRTVNTLPVLAEELERYRDGVVGDPMLVFGTAGGLPIGASNVRRRILTPSVQLANEKLRSKGALPLPEGVTPHALRRTFASLLFALGEAPPYVMAQLGHTSANLTLAAYARQMDRRDGERERLKRLVEGRQPG